MADLTTPSGPGRRAIAALIVVVVLLLLAIGSVNAATLTVASVNYRFEPDSQTVGVGDTVRWTFAGDPHTVTSGAPGAFDGRFDSGIKDPGGSFQVTFNSAGSFPYFCQIHPEEMFGTVVVGAATTPAPTVEPTPAPTVEPTPAPTASPTVKPTASRTVSPTVKPTASPTVKPTASPTPLPSGPSSAAPVQPASIAPISSPTGEPGEAPAGPSGAVSPSPAPTLVPDSGDATAAIDPAPIVGGVVLLGVLVGGGLAVARRAKRARP